MRKDEESRLGKYFCYISNAAGIQYYEKDDKTDETRPPFVGRIRPAQDKFFFEISKTYSFFACDPNSPLKVDCKGMTYRKYKFESNSSFIPKYSESDDTYLFSGARTMFNLFGDNSFSAATLFEDKYVMEGKCEKIK
ncbi:hypothetical protein [Methylobacterium sp. CM6257]